jgi:hypothetical protein
MTLEVAELGLGGFSQSPRCIVEYYFVLVWCLDLYQEVVAAVPVKSGFQI